MGMADYMIAGVVQSRRGVLVTGYRKRFERVEGLQLSAYVRGANPKR